MTLLFERRPSGVLAPLVRGTPLRQRKNPTHGPLAPDGRRYSICPAPFCGAVAVLSAVDEENADPAKRHERFECQRCGYVDCNDCIGNDHERN